MKILLADDHALFRQGLRHVLLELGAGTSILEAENLTQALALAQEAPDLDLVLVDLKMPDTQGLEAVLAFRQRYPELPVVVLSASEEHEDVEGVLDAGAMGFVPKSSSAQVMLNALRLIASGGVYLPPMLLNRAAAAKPGRAPALPLSGHGRIEGLTERQIEVLQLLGEGKANKLIARELALSEGTVKIHLAAIFRALNVANRTEAVLAAQRLNLPAARGAGHA